jgi:hypothetical protein
MGDFKLLVKIQFSNSKNKINWMQQMTLNMHQYIKSIREMNMQQVHLNQHILV